MSTKTPPGGDAPRQRWTDSGGLPLFETMDLQIATMAVSFLPETLAFALREQARFLFACCHRQTRMGHLLLDAEALPSLFHEEPDLLPPAATIRHIYQSLPREFHSDRRNPIVWEQWQWIYLRRLWRAELETARLLAERNQSPKSSCPANTTAPISLPDTLTETQITACNAALSNPLVLLSGGPGTGKTFTIFQTLRLVQHHFPEARVQLLAPTGKAVARMQESIHNALTTQDPGSKEVAPINLQSATLHRFLRERDASRQHYQPYPRPHDPVDYVIVDEASMVDLTLLHRLLQNLGPHTHLILMGDRFQLSSVQPGAVFADACEAFAGHGVPTLELQAPFRFGSDTGLHALSEAIRRGDSDQALQCLGSEDCDAALRRIDPSDPVSVETALREWTKKHLLPGVLQEDPLEAIRFYARSMLLCAQNEGPFGVHSLNHSIAQHCRHHFLQAALTPKSAHFWKPVMIRKNDPVLHLFNGDVGVVQQSVSAQRSFNPIGWFPSAEGRPVAHAAHVLPDYEDAFAYTVHKSQGSEADEVLLLLPDRPNPVLSRELLYTAISRAKRKVTVIASEAILRHCIEHPTQRMSRLRERIEAQLGS